MERDGKLFGRRLKAARDRVEISQRQLGFRIGLEPAGASTRINRYERGTRAPAFGIVCAMAAELGVPPSYFYEPDESLAELILLAGSLSGEARAALAAELRQRHGAR